MIQSYTFRYDELTIDIPDIIRTLGYQGKELPEPFASLIQMVSSDCHQLDDISGSYYITEKCSVDLVNRKVFANNICLKVGRKICNELADSTNLAFFICTAGKTISTKSTSLFKGEDLIAGYVYDIFGSSIAEAVADKIQSMIEHEVKESGNKTTNRYSPGYCNWHVSEQAKLFSLFNGSASGVKLTPTFLMTPIKSVSGIIGIGKNVDFHDYQCSLCNLKNCVNRKVN